MHKYQRLLSSLFFFLFVVFASAQTRPDTFDLAKKYLEEKDFGTAISLLKKHYKSHPENIYVAQFLAQSLYWNEQNSEADAFYQLAIQTHPQAAFLQLDYGRMLFQLGELKNAKAVLEKYLNRNSSDAEALINLGYINYWWGSYKEAQLKFQEVLKWYPENPIALEMTSQLKKITSHYLNTSLKYFSDTQPLQSGLLKVETGRYFSSLLKPSLALSWMQNNVEDGQRNIPLLELGNEMNFFQNNTHVNFKAGLFRNVVDEIQPSGWIQLRQNLTNKLSVNLTGQNQPYTFTLGSLKEEVSFKGLALSTHWNDPGKIQAEAFVGRNYFANDNELSTMYFWILSPDLGWEKIKFNVGYSYSFSDSKQNTFQSKISLSELLIDYQPGEIEGVYTPYFTPSNQKRNTIIGVVTFSTEKKFLLQLKGNVGFWNTAEIPYLYLDVDDDNDLFIAQDFAEENKMLYEISLTASYSLGPRTNINFQYLRTENFFYILNTFDLNFRYTFL